MILGVGIDITDIRRIAKALDRWGERFTRRCYTEIEREKSDRRYTRAESYARRWAAKEACAKALGTGFRRGVYHIDLGVVNRRGGQPTLNLTRGAALRLQQMIPAGMQARIDVSMTDEPPLAQAIVLITAVPPDAYPPA
ncbi:MAG: holo-ACP synthase [Alphaproteobacteria bacterium]